MKVCFCTPTLVRPWIEMNDAALAEVPFLQEAGIEDVWAWEIGTAYISFARALLIRKALKWLKDADGCVVFVDHDISWEPGHLTRLIQTPGDIVAGTYRFKSPIEEYMGRLDKAALDPIPERNKHGCLPAFLAPAGFLKISRSAIEILVEKYPELNFSRDYDNGDQHYDLFNHGVINGTWFGEDYAFSYRWNQLGLPLWILPDLSVHHWGLDYSKSMKGEKVCYRGNYWNFLQGAIGGKMELNKGRMIGEDFRAEAAAQQALVEEFGSTAPLGPPGRLWENSPYGGITVPNYVESNSAIVAPTTAQLEMELGT